MSKPSRRAARRDSSSIGAPRPSSSRTTPEAQHSSGPSGTPRAGRRQRVRVYDRPSLLQRYRTAIIVVAVAAAVVIVGAFAFASATAASYSCTNQWVPEPTASPVPGASPEPGYAQPLMGASHNVANPQVYTNCPPASGPHFNITGQGPIRPGYYAPDSGAVPMGWIHNLEHGALVLAYRCAQGDDCSDTTQQQLKAFYNSFPDTSPICGIPKGAVGPVIVRFDQMAYPFAAIVWGRVLPLQTLDTNAIQAFWNAWGDRTFPERGTCPYPGGSPSPGASAGPSGSSSPGTSIAPSDSGSPAASPTESGSPAASPSAS